MGKYAVINPATGETVKEYPEISDEELSGGDRGGDGRPPELGAEDLGLRAGRAGQEGGRASLRAAGDAGRDHRAGDGQADGAGPRRGGLLRRHLRLLRRQRGGVPQGRADQAAGGRGHRPDPADVGRARCWGSCPGTSPTTRWPASRGRTWSSGNTILLKPAHQCPESAEAIQPMIDGRRLPRRRLPDDPRLERSDRRA